MRILITLLLLIGTALANASEYAPLFRWTGPTAFVSGAPLDPLTDLSEYRLYCPGFSPNVTQTMPNVDNSFQAPVGMFPPGTYTCHMTAVDNDGGESVASGSATYTVIADQPGPIVIFTVE